MDFVTPLYKTLEAQATLDQAKATAIDTQALAQMRQQSVLLGNIRMQQQTNTMQALQQSVQGNVFDPSLEPQPDDTAVDAARKNAGRAAQQAQFSRRAAQRILQSGGDPQVARQYMQEADNAGWRSAQAQREALTEQKNLTSQLASIASTAKDDDTADAALQQMISIAPKIAGGLNLDRDPTSGKVVWGDNTQRTFNVVKAAGITAEQQVQNAQKVQAELDRQRIEERRVAKERSDEQVAAARIANLQAGTEYHQEQTKAIRGATGPGGIKITGPEQRTNAEIDQARKEISNLTPDQVSKYFDAASPESARNPAMMESIRKAGTLKYGPDPEYENVRTKLSPTANSLAAKAAAKAAPVATKPTVAAPKYTEGQTATGADGKKLIFKGGQWVPLTQ